MYENNSRAHKPAAVCFCSHVFMIFIILYFAKFIKSFTKNEQIKRDLVLRLLPLLLLLLLLLLISNKIIHFVCFGLGLNNNNNQNDLRARGHCCGVHKCFEIRSVVFYLANSPMTKSWFIRDDCVPNGGMHKKSETQRRNKGKQQLPLKPSLLWHLPQRERIPIHMTLFAFATFSC